ncbi:hypothetical protein CCY99_08425 [Helicobacter sp. 16-1353]|uniref:RpiB/LacA/LacB family sugar-phosphate isomerase n=1 Tax=Helicobacter sp. 16-1353 TaxID=2004996 RepID=UPI000DCCD168|nr:RpiB/LacA/LacB family sugar-phosphate isomerase [Helicobacter sp. 16-1353]RAX51816.1 hypothetical protein CCY99_08425 [Helicobacter sp. 16-1353]
MTCIIGSDHAGRNLANEIVEFLAEFEPKEADLKIDSSLQIDSLQNKIKIIKFIPESGLKVDYPDFAKLVCEEVKKRNLESSKIQSQNTESKNLDSADLSGESPKLNAFGILVCGSGIGMEISANKCSGIRAANCVNEYMAKYARRHNNANVLCLGERIVGVGLGLDIVEAFLNAEFEGGRHEIRVDKINLLD